MDSATLSPLSTIKIVNTLLLSPLQKSATLSPPKPKQKPLLLRIKSPFLTQCSAKPHTHKDNATNGGEDLSFELLNSRIGDEGEAKPVPEQEKQAVSSSLISRGLVLDLGCGDSWDNLEIGSPVVKRYLGDEEERWLMWYHGRSGKNPESESIGLAVSSNGIHWERGIGGVESSGDVGMVMNPSQDWWGFDTLSVIPGEVSIMSSAKLRANSAAVYWLYYTGFSAEKLEFPENFPFQNPERACSNSPKSPNCFKSLPGLAMSQDGRHWARIEGEHHSGALFDSGQEGEWDSLFISSPNVLFHGNGDLRMYYHSFDIKSSCFAIGMARSRDGIKWVKLGKILGGGGEGAFDERGVMNPNVVRNKRDGGYVMAYEGVGVDGKRSIGMAVSSDGLKGWRRVNNSKSVLKQCEEEDGWDSEGVGSPCLVEMDNGGEDCQWRLYYRGVGKGGRTGIGLAVSDGADFQRFQRWTGFHI
nr:Glycosyl hydrolase, five-bladed beta-propellor domain-containing protein [Ipomoea batatas]